MTSALPMLVVGSLVALEYQEMDRHGSASNRNARCLDANASLSGQVECWHDVRSSRGCWVGVVRLYSRVDVARWAKRVTLHIMLIT